MTPLIVAIFALALCIVVFDLRRQQRKRRRQMGLQELTPSLRDLRRGDMGRIRDLDEALQLDSPAWTDVTYHGRRP